MRDTVLTLLERLGTSVAEALSPAVPESISWLLAEPVAVGAAVAVAGSVGGAALLAGLLRRLRARASSDRRTSWNRHREAQSRAPPVDIGDVETAGIQEFSTHHSGERHAVCKVEGFVCFVEDVPDGVADGDPIRFRILSYNRGKTSATATFVDTA